MEQKAGAIEAGGKHGDHQGPATSGLPIDMSLGWCGGHGVPESVCSRCNASLIPQFKKAGDWCGGHDLPESQCESCNPGAMARWAAIKDGGTASTSQGQPPAPQPSAPQSPSPEVQQGPQTSAVPIDMSLGWCGGHGVPESVCTRCDASLIPQFKEGGDWCAEHGLPESQCELCNPGAMKRWAAIKKRGGPLPIHHEADVLTDATSARSGIVVEPNRRLLTGENSPLCAVDQLRVRFVDASILEKSGIETAPVARRRMSATIEMPAEVEYDQTRVTHVTSRVGGVVREAPVREGNTVAAGDVLGVLDSAELGEAKSLYIERRENLSLARADFDRVREIHAGTKSLLRACTADTPAERVREELAEVRVGEAKSRFLRAHAELMLARTTEARERELFEKQINSEQDLDRARSTLAAAEASFLALREEIAFDSDRARLAAERGVQVARAALEAAERKLHILGVTQDQIASLGEVDAGELQPYVLRSPVRGVVTNRHMSIGEAVEPTDRLLTVVDTSSMWLRMSARERDLGPLREGLPVLLTISGLPGRAFTGRVTWIASAVDNRTRSLTLRAELPNEDGLLKAQMFGTARVVLHDNEELVTVPEPAVQTDGCCQLVFVRESDTVYAPRKVVMGTGSGGFVEIVKGLSVGEVVATTGSFLMKTEILKGNIGAGCCEVDPGR